MTSHSSAAAGGGGAPVPHVLREYALLADGERGAMLGPRGDIACMCAPRWDSGSVFASLVGGTGVYSVAPTGRYVWGGYYEPRSLIWHSRWVTAGGIVECREALAYPGEPHRLVLLRTVHAVNGPATVDVTLRPRADYDTAGLSELKHTRGVWTFRCGELHGRWTSGPGARAHDDAIALHLTPEPGERHDLVLELSDRPLPGDAADPGQSWEATEANWHARIAAVESVLAPRDTAHSMAVLHGLTSATGGMVAAATTSLPERSDADRNYDYRYVWIRDQCYAGHAALAAGDDVLLDAAVGYLTARLHEHGPHLAPAYTVTGAPVPAQRHLGLPGYPGGSDIVGNQAGEQFQLDAYGEGLLLLAGAAGRDRLNAEGWTAAEQAADAIAARWREPDAGIWEIDNRAWTHSRLIASAGLRAVAAARPGPASSRWLTLADQILADQILADTTAHALHPDGYWQRSPDDTALDAALLLPGLRGALATDDPRTVATLHAYLRELTEDGYAYRFRHDARPLADAEGSFLLCGFFTALALDTQSSRIEARAWFERTRAATGPPELFSEEYDAHQHQMRGNLPQAFVHALMVETASRLAEENNHAPDPAT
ncbi:MAG: glycoside hydrolase family 15 protein [Jatrophihabitans sp.]